VDPHTDLHHVTGHQLDALAGWPVITVRAGPLDELLRDGAVVNGAPVVLADSYAGELLT